MCLKFVDPSTLTSLGTAIKSFSTSSNKGRLLMSCLPIRTRSLAASLGQQEFVYNYDHLSDFLSSYPHINNRLACLVIEVMELSYLKVILVVIACLGAHLVEPFYARTIEKDATHTELRYFYKSSTPAWASRSVKNTPNTPGQSSLVCQRNCSLVSKRTIRLRCWTLVLFGRGIHGRGCQADQLDAASPTDSPGQAEERLWTRRGGFFDGISSN